MSLIATLERAVVALAQALLRQISDGNPLAMATALRLAEAVLADVIDSESRTA